MNQFDYSREEVSKAVNIAEVFSFICGGKEMVTCATTS